MAVKDGIVDAPDRDVALAAEGIDNLVIVVNCAFIRVSTDNAQFLH